MSCDAAPLAPTLAFEGDSGHLRQPSKAALEEVRTHLLLRACEYFRFLHRPLSVRVERVRRESTNPLRRFAISDGERRANVIAKWAPVYASNNEGLTEYRHYYSFNSECASPAIQCPRPLAFLDKSNALLTEEHSGVPMSLVLKSFAGAASRTHLTHSVRLAARWLSAFHKHWPSTAVPAKTAWPFIEHSCPWMTERQLAGEGFRTLESTSLSERVWCLREAVRKSDFPVHLGEMHREFGPANILVCGEGVTVLDAPCNEHGPQLFDVAEFVAYLRILDFISLRTEMCCRSLEDVFLAEYFGLNSSAPDRGQSRDRALLLLLTVGGVLRNQSRHVKIAEALLGPVKRACREYFNRNYRRTLATLVA